VAILSRLGCAAFGESRDQEAAAKVDEVARLLGGRAGAGAGSAGPHWHMVGKIQRNKARSLAGWAHTAHSVSSTRVVAALDRAVAGALSEGRRKNPPLDWEPDRAFALLQSEHHRVRRAHPAAVGLSAGMSSDLEIAIKHGSTCVRVGTALLGQRPLPSPSIVTPVTSSSQTPESPEL
jgi:uncharacterized pyridoxal phosphate-containing UPF0001 family protein